MMWAILNQMKQIGNENGEYSGPFTRGIAQID